MNQPFSYYLLVIILIVSINGCECQNYDGLPTPTSGQTSTQTPPILPLSGQPHNDSTNPKIVSIGKHKGMPNLGATCYMNSIIQALTSFYQTQLEKAAPNRADQGNKALTKTAADNSSKPAEIKSPNLATATRTLFNNVTNPQIDDTTLQQSAKDFFENLAKKETDGGIDWKPKCSTQEDAGELLLKLLGWMKVPKIEFKRKLQDTYNRKKTSEDSSPILNLNFPPSKEKEKEKEKKPVTMQEIIGHFLTSPEKMQMTWGDKQETVEGLTRLVSTIEAPGDNIEIAGDLTILASTIEAQGGNTGIIEHLTTRLAASTIKAQSGNEESASDLMKLANAVGNAWGKKDIVDSLIQSASRKIEEQGEIYKDIIAELEKLEGKDDDKKDMVDKLRQSASKKGEVYKNIVTKLQKLAKDAITIDVTQEAPMLQNLPTNGNDVLVVSLNRAGKDGKKDTTLVQNPFELITIPQKKVVGFTSDITYQLMGFIQHLGNSGNGGHYVAYINEKDEKDNKDKWILYNDNDVSVVSNETARAAAASSYIYFYKPVPIVHGGS